jgi:NAD(P)-dependent dehydrogenase (short-subunit alcohol dehydrogenase family)
VLEGYGQHARTRPDHLRLVAGYLSWKSAPAGGAAMTDLGPFLTDTAEIRAVVEQAFAGLGTIDVVVNNAGYGLFGAAEEVTDEQIRHIVGTNLLGSI